MSKIRVLLADDHAVLRAGLKLLINAEDDMQVVAEAGSAQEAWQRALEQSVDVLSLDLTMPGGKEVQLIDTIRERLPKTRVLVLTMHDDPALLRSALAAGAKGFLIKTVADLELLAAIRAVAQGRSFLDLHTPSLASALEPHNAAAPEHASHRLSVREREVLALVAQGHTNQAIADQLDLSVKTIETYRARVMGKLGLRSRAEIIRYALQSGLLKATPESPSSN